MHLLRQWECAWSVNETAHSIAGLTTGAAVHYHLIYIPYICVGLGVASVLFYFLPLDDLFLWLKSFLSFGKTVEWGCGIMFLPYAVASTPSGSSLVTVGWMLTVVILHSYGSKRYTNTSATFLGFVHIKEQSDALPPKWCISVQEMHICPRNA